MIPDGPPMVPRWPPDGPPMGPRWAPDGPPMRPNDQKRRPDFSFFLKSQLLLSFVQFRRNEAMRDRKKISNGGLGFSFFLNGGELCPNYENKLTK